MAQAIVFANTQAITGSSERGQIDPTKGEPSVEENRSKDGPEINSYVGGARDPGLIYEIDGELGDKGENPERPGSSTKHIG